MINKAMALFPALAAAAALAQGQPVANGSGAPAAVPSLAASARPEKRLLPEYPPAAIRREEQGRVLVRLRVLASGAVAGLQLLSSSGHASLDEAAMNYLSTARFVPARDASGSPVDSLVAVPIDFVLEDQVPPRAEQIKKPATLP